MPTTTELSTLEQIENDAAKRSTAEIATYLQAHLGQRPTAYLSGLKDAKTVGQWAAGKVTPRSSASLRLRHAYQAARVLVEAFGDETAQAWFFGTNSQLGGEAPAFVLRHAELPEEVAPIVRAAASFAETGHGQGLQERIMALERRQADLRREIRELMERLELASLGNTDKGVT